MKNNKIALCFLTYGNLSQSELWKNFLTPDYNVYIHNKNNFTGFFEKYCIKNKLETKYGDITLVKATLRLFEEAYKNNENKYFILLSDKCIPLYSGDEIYKKINEIDDNAFYFCHKGSIDRHSYLKDKSFIKIDNWYKQSQWMILKRETVNFFLKNDYIDIFSNSKLFAPDEHYFINIIKKFNISLTFHGVSHVNWKESEQFRRPKTYYILTNEIIENILKSKCLFMRKVSSECELPSYFDKISNKK